MVTDGIQKMNENFLRLDECLTGLQCGNDGLPEDWLENLKGKAQVDFLLKEYVYSEAMDWKNSKITKYLEHLYN